MDDYIDLDDDIDLDQDGGVVDPAWWSAASLLSAEATAIAAFTFAVLAMFGGATIASVVADSVVGVSWDPADVSWHPLFSAGTALLFALGAILLGRRVIVDQGDEPTRSGHLARAAVVVGAVASMLSGVAMLSVVLRSSPGG